MDTLTVGSKVYDCVGRTTILRPDGETLCSVIGCGNLAACLIGCGDGHPTCPEHVASDVVDHICDLPAFWTPEDYAGTAPLPPSYRMLVCGFCGKRRPKNPESEQVGSLFICDGCAS